MRLSARQRASWLAHLFKASTRQHHRHLRALFAPYVPINGVVVDVGAHAGQFSKLFARMASGGHVYAFEPSAYARSIMTPALRFNRIRNVTLTPAGLSDVSGRLTLRTPLKRSSALGYGVAHLGADRSDGAAIDQTVDLTTLDDFATLCRLKRLDLIKADVEGWELRALRGGCQTLARFHPTLYLEVDAALLSRAGDSPESLFDWLGDLGYRAFSTPDLRPAPQWQGPGDYLFTRTRQS
jgi:FkbM family methyltransferase